MHCPNCAQTELVNRTVEGIGIDRCESCGGIWLDMLELERLIQAKPRELIREDRAAAEDAEKPGDGQRPCPNCRGGYLIKLNSLHRRGTIVDSCTVCHGTWLDAGELSRLQGGGLVGWVRDLFGG